MLPAVKCFPQEMLKARAQRLKRCLQPRAVRFPELCSTPGVPALCSAQGHGGNLPESASSFRPGRQRAGSSPCCQYGESRSPSTSGWKSNHAARSCSVRSHSGDRATCRAGMGSSSAPQKPHTRLWGEGNLISCCLCPRTAGQCHCETTTNSVIFIFLDRFF